MKKSCARTFQALRIDVNSEFEVLEAFLEKLPDVMDEIRWKNRYFDFPFGRRPFSKKIFPEVLPGRALQ